MKHYFGDSPLIDATLTATPASSPTFQGIAPITARLQSSALFPPPNWVMPFYQLSQGTNSPLLASSHWQVRSLAEASQWTASALAGHTRRYEHSLGVCEMAFGLAQACGLSRDEAYLAALAGVLHDHLKPWRIPQHQRFAQSHQLSLTSDDLASPATLHALTGARRVQVVLGIDTSDVLLPIAAHTVGDPLMADMGSRVGLLAAVLYCADKLETRTRSAAWTTPIWSALAAWEQAQVSSTITPALLLRVLTVLLLSAQQDELLAKGLPVHPRAIMTLAALIQACEDEGLAPLSHHHTCQAVAAAPAEVA